MSHYRQLAVALLLASVACATTGTSFGEQQHAALLRSTDRVALYDAGVDAFRTQRHAAARALWRRAADLGHREAASNLGFLLYHGFGGPPDSASARALWNRAMKANTAEAHLHVARAILNGDRVLGTLAEGCSHAVAAGALSRTPDQLAGSAVALDATALVATCRGLLTPSELEAMQRRGLRWAERYPSP